jgi:cardiolipin synthase
MKEKSTGSGGVGKRRKGSVIMYSRLPAILLLVVLQVVLITVLYVKLSEAVPYIAIVQAAFTVGVFFYLSSCRMDPTGKLSWLAVVALFPFPGTLMLIFYRSNLGHRRIRAGTAHITEETRGLLPRDAGAERRLALESPDMAGLCDYVNKSGCMPVFGGTDVTYFSSGEDCFAAMAAELERAEKFIFLEFFIIEEGAMWDRILGILKRKAAEGVDVRVLVDGMCELAHLPRGYVRRLASLGIKAKTFSPIYAFVSTRYNYRDHRKIVVIDNRVAFNGGLNIADEYINVRERFGHWKDTAVMLRGEAAKSFTLMFTQMWSLTDPVHDYSPALGDGLSVPAEGFVMPFGDSPLDSEKVTENVYTDILYRARRYVYIMTPYMILDGELETALKYAAGRGVDVRIILPGIPDKKIPYALAKSHYGTLMASGVRIFEYTPGFIHAKVFVSDGKAAVVGTANLDYRSLYHHFESSTFLYGAPCVGDIEADFRSTFEKCREATPESVRNEKFFYKFAGVVMKIIAPLL